MTKKKEVKKGRQFCFSCCSFFKPSEFRNKKARVCKNCETKKMRL